HHYELTEDRLIKKVNLIVATTNNNGAINMSIRNAARELIKHNINKAEMPEELLNTIEMFYRAYDPCMACASHSLGAFHLQINIYDKNKNLIRTISS
ncbi:MAG: nickel-dependent hydrogenase large subunit, partial [candidate division WOR-3 bacterium]|nr:nickel-dependent hydrogenase large subunit [candidate division WOR-3 bacterium]